MSSLNLQPKEYTSTQNDAWGIVQEIVNQSSSIVIAGETGSGKTNLLKALVETIPFADDLHTVLIENRGENELSTWADRKKESIREDDDDRPMAELIKESLRETPKRVIVSEITGKEAAGVIEALEKGWVVMATIHAKSIKAVPVHLAKLAQPVTEFSPDQGKKAVYKALDYGVLVDVACIDKKHNKNLYYIKEVVRYSNGQIVQIFTQSVLNNEVVMEQGSGYHAFMKAMDERD